LACSHTSVTATTSTRHPRADNFHGRQFQYHYIKGVKAGAHALVPLVQDPSGLDRSLVWRGTWNTRKLIETVPSMVTRDGSPVHRRVQPVALAPLVTSQQRRQADTHVQARFCDKPPSLSGLDGIQFGSAIIELTRESQRNGPAS
jgi:hypothetical protein